MLYVKKRPNSWTLLLLINIGLLDSIQGHGRLIEPPSRSSAWRYGFQTPPNYNDHELYCGGFTRQWKVNGGKCGECGDAWDLQVPRPNEYGGKWGTGVIVRRYEPATNILIRVELTASHMGYFEFRICDKPKAKQSCLDKHLLEILNGTPSNPQPGDITTRFYPRNGSQIYEIKAVLPNIICSNCVLQWRYEAGNNWGICADGNGAVGCGPQEEFRGCADIAIGVNNSNTKPIHPIIRTTMIPKTSTENPQTEDNNLSQRYDFLSSWLVFLLVLLIVLCGLCTWYFQQYHDKIIKQCFDSLTHRFKKSSKTSLNKLGSSSAEHQFESRPIPPPRTRRNSKIKELTTEESSIA